MSEENAIKNDSKVLGLGDWVNGVPLTETVKMIKEAALGRNQELCFKYIKFECLLDIQVAMSRGIWVYECRTKAFRVGIVTSVCRADI